MVGWPHNRLINLLSLGPGFAVAPDVNDKLLHEVEVSLAQCSYSMKWKQKIVVYIWVSTAHFVDMTFSITKNIN